MTAGAPDTFSDIESFLAAVRERVAAPGRLAAVAATDLAGTEAETGFDRIAALAARVLDAPYAFITLVDDEYSHWKACIGIESSDPVERRNAVEASFCQYVIGLDDILLINDARLDERTRDNPSIEAMGVIAWAGVPLRAETGEVLGTVCVVDTRPRRWSGADADLLVALSEIAADEIAARSLARAAQRAESILNAVLERAPIGFALVDNDLRYQMVNEALADINGVPADSHIGRAMRDLVPDFVDVVEPALRRVLDTGEAVSGIEITGETPSQPGVTRHWYGSYYRLDIGAERPSAGLFIEEVTAQVRSRRRAEHLASITADLTKAAEVADIDAIVGASAAEYFEADFALLGLLDGPNDSIRIRPSDAAVDALDGFVPSTTDESPYTEAYRTGEMVVVESRAERIERFPHHPADLGFEASVAIPCSSSTGTRFGVLVVAWARPMQRRELPLAQLRTFAALVSQSIERTRASEQRQTLIATLQRTLLGVAPEIPNLDVAVRYVPAGEAIGFGGDWYDLVRIDDDRVALVVGDVVGHDAHAAAHMARIRTVITSLLKLDTDLGDLFVTAERLLRDDAEPTMASVGVTIVDTRTHRASMVSAGHPPPVLVAPDGGVEVMTPALGPWVGVGCSSLEVTTRDLTPGSTLVMYSDGLVERRDHDIDADIERLSSHLAGSHHTTVEQVATGLVDDFVDGADRLDDIAVIVARC